MREENLHSGKSYAQKSFRYTFRLSTEQNEQFMKMAEQAGCTSNKSKFIISRIFG